MSNGVRLFSRIRRNKFTPLICLFCLILMTFIARSMWMQRLQKQFDATLMQTHSFLETNLAKDQKISTEQLQNILKTNPRVALFVFDNQLEKSRIGFINAKSFDQGANQLGNFYNEHTTEEVLQEIIQNPQTFSNSYLEIQNRPVFRTMQNQKVKIGQVAMGYIAPGYHASMPKAGGYYDTLYKGWLIFLLSNVMLYPLYLRRRDKAPVVRKEKDHLEWLEADLQTGNFEEDTTRDDFQQKPGWTELFNQSDLKDWNVKGEWYVKDQTVLGFPWGGSITSKYDLPFTKYEFEVEGQRMVGTEGFIVLFPMDGKQLTWVLGGWKNSRSEVVGYEHTKTDDKLEKFRWYYIKIECDGEKIYGFLDGRKVWEIEKKDLKPQKEELGFQQGFGVAVWSTMVRFQRIRIISTE